MGGILALKLGYSFISCAGEEFYSPDDFEKAPKADAHFHYNTSDDAVLKYAASINMHILTINVDSGEDEAIDRQFAIAQSLKNKHPDMIDFLGTFSVTGFGNDHFADETIAQINKCMKAGAKGIKIWKNIGRVLKDRDDQYVMVDHPAFAPIFAYLEKEGIPLVTHLGEPRNCWLPYEEMTMGSDLNYLQLHTMKNRDQVKSFFIKYQDRITYGSDTGIRSVANIEQRCRDLYHVWRMHWLFLATDEATPAARFNMENAPEQIIGLKLPKKVVDKIFYGNVKRVSL
jgi:hypothetical protein